MTFSHQTESKEEKTEIPKKVDITLLYPNGTLISDAKRNFIETLKIGHHKRKKNWFMYDSDRIDSDYSITKVSANVAYAHYHERGRRVILGEGGTAKAKILQNISPESKEFVVAKISKPKNDQQKQKYYEDALNEVKILRLLGRAKSGLLIRKQRKNPDFPKFEYIMEMARGKEIFRPIIKNKLPYDSIKLLRISLNVGYAVKDFFEMRYLHRDLKEENILLDELAITLIDFAYSARMDEHQEVHDPHLVGTRANLAPELVPFSDVYSYSEATEVYALGKILTAILFGIIALAKPELQYYRLRNFTTVGDKMIFKKEAADEKPAEQYELDLSLFNFIKERMLNNDPKQRPTLQQTIETLEQYLKALEQDQTKQEDFRVKPQFVSKIFSFFKPPLCDTLIGLLNQGIPVMDESKRNDDGSLKQFLVFDDKKVYSQLLKKLYGHENGLQQFFDFRIIQSDNENRLEIMGRIKIDDEGIVTIKDLPAHNKRLSKIFS